MVVLLLVIGAVWVLLMGVGLWEVCRCLLTTEIPAAIEHPVRLWVLHCLLQVLMAWGKILEKLRICSMPQFVRFVHDLQPLKTDPAVVVKDLRLGTIPVKLYQPKAPSCSPRPGIVFVHGGGTIFGSLKFYHRTCCRLSKESDSVVLAVGYRQPPEHRYPMIIVDCFAATICFLRSLDRYGVDPARVVICGDSVGGAVATLICQKLVKSSDLPKIRAQILVYAPVQLLDFQLPSYQQNRNVPLINLDFVYQCFVYYLDISPTWKNACLKGAHVPAEVWAKYRKWVSSENIPERFKKRGYKPLPPMPLNESAYLETNLLLDLINEPLLAEDEVVSRLPETCIISCEYDVLRDNSLLYKKRLEDLGVPVTWHHMEDGFHGVLSTIDMGFLSFPCSTRIMNNMAQFIKGL
ncbi:arylacetamide deacetylase-like 3 [Molossus molossus]|uniref:Arylacetamide deacetylase like 3 n=1 Tax=Molossus molossus TaxID=27622 RepID=A0A7J8F5G1_MOLMO|nr:arylacetamide deacetylase-like 3 [Molossus molossus]KAF6442984.1 arylacetamide deacetylase like 3 [Molossus molossus]